MSQSAGLRFLLVAFLTLVMLFPLNLVTEVVRERAAYSDTARAAISREWGGAQVLSGPVLVIPVTEDVTKRERRLAIDPATGQSMRDDRGRLIYEHLEETVAEDRPPVFLFAESLDVSVSTESQVRRRGIFEVPVFTAAIEADFGFPTDAAERELTGDEALNWDAAQIRVFLSENRALRGEALLEAGDAAFQLDPISEGKASTGIMAVVGDVREAPGFRLSLNLNGAEAFRMAATGRTTRLAMESDWPHPSFFGDFLPDGSEVTDAGFTANWTIPHLARSLPQVSRELHDQSARLGATMGARYLTPNDFYQKAWRSARYGVLFVSLTFLTIFLMDRASARPAHGVQYLMIGLAQAIFTLLMVAYAEQIGFGAAYLLAASATIGLITAYSRLALGMGARSWVLAGVLASVYGVLYLILQSTDYALLAGSTLAFAALALTMFLTRNETWGGGGFALSWPRRRARPDSALAS